MIRDNDKPRPPRFEMAKKYIEILFIKKQKIVTRSDTSESIKLFSRVVHESYK